MHLLGRTTDISSSPISEAYAWLASRTSTRQLIDLSQAAPSYPPPQAIIDQVARTAHDPNGGRYCPTSGLPALTEAFATELSSDYRTRVEPHQILPSSGCNQAFCVTVSALAARGDEIILPVPYYFNHEMWLKLDGITPRLLRSDESFVPDPAEARKLINERTRAIVLVTPGNPTGVTMAPAVIQEFFELAQAHKIALIVDETYRNFRPIQTPPHELYNQPDWEDTAIFLHSFSKDLAIPGYRIGAIVAGASFLHEAMKLLDCVQISPPRVSQEAVVAGLTRSGDWRTAQATRIRGLQEQFESVMAARPGGFALASSGAFFGWVRHPFADLDTAEVVRRLVVDHDVLLIPGTAFTPTDERWLRMSFANLTPEQFPILAERLVEFSNTVPEESSD